MMDDRKMDILTMVRPSVLRLKPYASAKDEFKDFQKKLIYLDANENPYETTVNRYPDPDHAALKSALSERKGVRPENILFGNGSDEILDLIFRVFVEPGQDKVLINPPTFGMFEVLAGIHNVNCQEVLLTPDFQLDVQGIWDSVGPATKVVFVCSPNNPTGNAMDLDDIKKLLSLPVIVVVDEAYADFSEKKSALSLLEDHPNLIVTQTFSKAYGLAGLRLGMCYASSEVISVLRKVKMPYNVNTVTQQMAMERLKDQEQVDQEIASILEGKDWLVQKLSQSPIVKKIFPSDSNFLLVRVDDADQRYKQFVERGIVVRNRSRVPLCDNCLRFTVGTESENQKLIEAMSSMASDKLENK